MNYVIFFGLMFGGGFGFVALLMSLVELDNNVFPGFSVKVWVMAAICGIPALMYLVYPGFP